MNHHRLIRALIAAIRDERVGETWATMSEEARAAQELRWDAERVRERIAYGPAPQFPETPDTWTGVDPRIADLYRDR